MKPKTSRTFLNLSGNISMAPNPSLTPPLTPLPRVFTLVPCYWEHWKTGLCDCFPLLKLVPIDRSKYFINMALSPPALLLTTFPEAFLDVLQSLQNWSGFRGFSSLLTFEVELVFVKVTNTDVSIIMDNYSFLFWCCCCHKESCSEHSYQHLCAHIIKYFSEYGEREWLFLKI